MLALYNVAFALTFDVNLRLAAASDFRRFLMRGIQLWLVHGYANYINFLYLFFVSFFFAHAYKL